MQTYLRVFFAALQKHLNSLMYPLNFKRTSDKLTSQYLLHLNSAILRIAITAAFENIPKLDVA